MTPLGLPEELPDSPEHAVLVIPHAGGGSAIAHPLRAACPPSWLVAGVMFGGRESRFADAPPAGLGELVTDVATAATELAAVTGRVPVLVGQCSGALLAWLAAARLAGSGQLVPGLAVLSRVAPACPGEIPDATAAHDDFAAQVLEQGGVPPEVAELPGLLDLLLPALRADFACLAEWNPQRAAQVPVLAVPALAIYSDADPQCPEPAVAAWRRQLPALELAPVPGVHFLINKYPALVVACLRRWGPLLT